MYIVCTKYDVNSAFMMSLNKISVRKQSQQSGNHAVQAADSERSIVFISGVFTLAA